MAYTFNPFTGNLDFFQALTNPLQFMGGITVAADFPTSALVQNGWVYRILANVTDNNPAKTNTGQSFLNKDEIAWNGTNWTVLGNESAYVPYTGAVGNVNIGIYTLTGANFISSVAIGTSPYACTSTTLNTNLNADLLDGQHAAAFLTAVPYSVSDKTNNYPVVNTDLGSGTTFTMNNGATKTFTLPTSANIAGHLGAPITFVKKGAGRVTIQANTGQVIRDSSTAGTIYNDQATETYASITLIAITTTQWIVQGFDGTWTTS